MADEGGPFKGLLPFDFAELSRIKSLRPKLCNCFRSDSASGFKSSLPPPLLPRLTASCTAMVASLTESAGRLLTSAKKPATWRFTKGFFRITSRSGRAPGAVDSMPLIRS